MLVNAYTLICKTTACICAKHSVYGQYVCLLIVPSNLMGRFVLFIAFQRLEVRLKQKKYQPLIQIYIQLVLGTHTDAGTARNDSTAHRLVISD